MSVDFHAFVGTVVPDKWRFDYQQGHLRGAVEVLMRQGLQTRQFIKSGSTCLVWLHPNNTQVVKLCTKRIEYFKTHPKSQVKDFHHLINHQLSGVFLPIDQILYEDANYFVYTQERIQILDLSEINVDVYDKILETVKQMFKVGVLTCDLISSNFGWSLGSSRGGRVLYLLDYHDIKPVSHFLAQRKWSKIVRCLLEYTSYLVAHKGFEAHTGESFLEWKNEATIVKKKYGFKFYKRHFVSLFKSLSGQNVDQIIYQINKSQKKIRA